MIRVLKRVAIYGIVVFVVVLFVFPYLWMVLTAFKTGPDLIAVPPKIVFEPSLQNFRDLIHKFHVLPAIWNSVIVILMR
jgi:ABC-type glycerol-3-phosphate transport system permease component